MDRTWMVLFRKTEKGERGDMEVFRSLYLASFAEEKAGEHVTHEWRGVDRAKGVISCLFILESEVSLV
jgi:hypothetical protein